MDGTLTLNELRDAVAGTHAALRRRLRLQPAGGPGDKVFPPTYVGAVYAVERRRIGEEVKECVLLDSVQSQANRMEEALQEAVDEGRLSLPLVVVDFSSSQGLLDEIGRVTSLQAPHRVADAILRDSMYKGRPFRESDEGKGLNSASARNATPVFELSPTSLLLGMWDSHGPKGGLGAKFERGITSEIVGVGVEFGVRTGGRIDCVGIRREAATIYEAEGGTWTLDADRALKDKNGRPRKVKEGRPSEIGHGNVAPGFVEYGKGAKGRDPISGQEARMGNIAPGGVTMEYALHTTVLSLPALRRLQFPLNGARSPEVDLAARTAIAALGLCAATLATDRGYDLRSRCVLVADDEPEWELLGRPGSEPRRFKLTGDQALELLAQAIDDARSRGLPWREAPIELQPSEQLLELVRRSQELDAARIEAEEEA